MAMRSVRIALVAWACNISFIVYLNLCEFAGDRNEISFFYNLSVEDEPVHDLYDYDSIYRSFGSHKSYEDVRLFEFKSFDTYTSPGVRNNGCRLTVVVVDPRPPTSMFNHSIWYALESVATHVPYACVVINTASCQVFNQSYDNVIESSTNQEEVNVVASVIYERALPLFRRMMEYGLVRINILNIKKYGLHHCDNFENGNSIFMNIHFWTDEFIEGLDGETVLIVQDDSVLCRHFDIDSWRHFAYVGAPWPPWVITCESARETWQKWAPRCNGVTEHQLNESMSQFCTKRYGGFQGNGGLSLRNRSWMIEAIQRCPTHYSGLDKYESFHYRNEDLYFAQILTGLNAHMPSAFEASLFSVESLFPEQTAEYVNLEESEVVDTIERLWNTGNGFLLYQRMHQHESYFENSLAIEIVPQLHTIPLGFHKPWLYHSNIILQGAQVREECKFLKFVLK
jgi:hypothetical protein